MRNWINLIEATMEIVPEADIEDIMDIVQDFVNRIDTNDQEVFNEIYPEESDSGGFAQLFMGGYQEDGFSKEAAMEIINPLISEVEQKGWFLAKAHVVIDPRHDDPDSTPQIMIYFGFFPKNGEKEIVPRKVYHISPRENRDAIEKNGIRASRGGSDFIQTETPRVYVILDSDNIDAIKRDIAKHRGNIEKWHELDVWVIDAWSVEDRWFTDVELLGVAAWTPHDIPASAIWRE